MSQTKTTTHETRVKALHHVVVNVRDFDAALDFFVGILGMEPEPEAVMRGRAITDLLGLPADSTGRQVFLRGPGPAGQVEVVEWSVPGHPTERAITDLGLSLISFGVSPRTFDDLLERCRSAGVEILGGPEVLDIPEYAPTRLALVRGPEGVPVEFMAPAATSDRDDDGS